MKPVIRLQDFVQEMDIVSDEIQVFLNIRTGEFVMLSDEELRAAEERQDLAAYPEWQRESIQNARAVLDTDD